MSRHAHYSTGVCFSPDETLSASHSFTVPPTDLLTKSTEEICIVRVNNKRESLKTPDSD